MQPKNSKKPQAKPPANGTPVGKMPSGENIGELYEYVQWSLTFIETKNGVILTLLGGLIATILSFSTEICHRLWLYLSIIPPAAALVPLLLSFYPVTRLRCRRKNSASRGAGENRGLFRCENIAKISKDELARGLSGELRSCKIEYIHSASKTAARKYRLSRISIRLLFGIYIVYACALFIAKVVLP